MGIADSSDGALLSRWREGDRAAADVLIDRYWHPLYGFLASKLDSGVEDVMQQVFLGLLEGRDRFESRSSLRTYLFSIARHQLYNRFRELRRDPSIDFTTTSLHDLGTSPSGVLARQQSHERLHAALAQLPLDQRVALELAYWHDLTPAELGEVLDVNLNTVYSRLRRARNQLREALRDADDDSRLDVEQTLREAAPQVEKTES